jgi:hypothetical protein
MTEKMMVVRSANTHLTYLLINVRREMRLLSHFRLGTLSTMPCNGAQTNLTESDLYKKQDVIDVSQGMKYI